MSDVKTSDVLNKDIKRSNEPTFADAPTSKKIGFFSAMMIAFGSCVGAGIFFKASTVLQQSGMSFVLAIFTWLIAGFVVMSMALALMEIASARNDNLSMIGWCKTFNSRIIYKACKNFMFYIYLPLTYFFMPLYVIMSFQDGIAAMAGSANIGTQADWAIMMVIAIVMSAYFIFACGFSSKWGDIQNKIITYIKFIPLVAAVVFGIWMGIVQKPEINVGFPGAGNIADGIAAGKLNFATMTPGFGLFIAMGSIFFAYDGFYVAAGLQSEMKEPKKTPLALVVGLGLVTLVYLAIAISMSLNPDGMSGFGDFFKKQGNWGKYVFGVFNILIGIGVIGIINGFALWAPRFTEDLIREAELPFSEKAARVMASEKWGNRPWMGMLYNVIISFPIVIIFCVIGGLGYIDANGYGLGYGTGVAKLYSFADLMATWTAVFAFLFIILAIFGGLRNRKTNFVKTEKSKIFIPFAYISIIFGGIVVFLTFFAPFADVFMIIAIKKDVAGESYNSIIISRVLTLIVLFLQLGIMFLPAIIEDAINTKKYGSAEKADEIQAARVQLILEGENPDEVVIKEVYDEQPQPVLIKQAVNNNPVEQVQVEESKQAYTKEPEEINLTQNDNEPVELTHNNAKGQISYFDDEDDDLGFCDCEDCRRKLNK